MTFGVAAQTKQTFHQFGTLCTNQTSYTQNLTLTHIEADIAEALWIDRSEILNFKYNITRNIMTFWIKIGQLTTNHLGDDGVNVQIFRCPGSDILTISHDGNFVGNSQNLIHLVADVYNCNALAAQFVYDCKQSLYLSRSQRRGWLIQNQYLTVSGYCFCNLNQLHLGYTQGSQFCLRIKVQMNFF